MQKPSSVEVGARIGRLKVLSESGFKVQPSGQRKRLWKCRCDCGTVCIVMGGNLKTGNSTSCGCHHKEATSKAKTTHGCSRPRKWTIEYTKWAAMMQRCTNPKSRRYSDYGGRGIRVCRKWMKFINFLSDMGICPSPSHTLGRKSNSKGYSPKNCRWETRIEQANNKRTSRLITAFGRTMTLAQWGLESPVTTSAIYRRIKSGWDAESAIKTPPMQ